MASKTQIANLALAHLGHGVQLADVTTDTTQAGDVCRLFYDQVVGEVLRDFPYPFTTRTVALALEESDPTSEWGYSYRYPSECHQFRRILNGSGDRFETEATRVRFRIAGDDTGGLIYTDQVGAEGEYTVLVTDTTLYPPDLVQSIALLLASYMAPSLGGANAVGFGNRALQLYVARKDAAQRNAANEETPDGPGDDSYTQSRT